MSEFVDEQIRETGRPYLGWITGRKTKARVHVGDSEPACKVDVEGIEKTPVRAALHVIAPCGNCEKKL